MMTTDPQSERSHLGLLAELATEYYLEGLSKVEMARRHELSRFQIARLLDQARDEGIVRITIVNPSDAGAEHDDLARALGVSTVTVVAQRSDETLRSALARQVADLLPRRLHDDARLGVAWSRTLMHLPEHLGELPKVDVVQLVGPVSAPGSTTGDSAALVHRLGARAGGQVWPLPTPLIVESPEVAAALRASSEVRSALDAADELDVAVIAIGAWDAGISTVWARVSDEEKQRARDAGAIAECSGILLDAQGRVARTGMEERVIGVTPAQLRRTRVLAVAPAVGYPEAVLAAARGGFVDDLVISAELADQLMDLLAAEQLDALG
ncbi:MULTISPECIES: sugar-binding transcriptional regulator [Actinomycetes]|nr:sugar-binding domain-containing protein [Nesterenkonia sp. PF2B19]